MKLNAQALRTNFPDKDVLANIKRNPIYIILDNVLDTYNVGSIFRLADAISVTEVYLCGATETPPNTRIKKASINTWQWVSWKYSQSTVLAIQELREKHKDLHIVSVEQNTRSIPIKDFKPRFPIAVVVGNETYGVSKEVLDVSDTIVELPMFGVNTSLNVMVTCGIFLYKCVEYLPE